VFVRRKPSKGGVVSIQLFSNIHGKYSVVKTIGSSKDPEQIHTLVAEGEQHISSFTKQSKINFEIENERVIIDLFFKGIDAIRLVWPELLLGKLFDEIGFNKISSELLRPLGFPRTRTRIWRQSAAAS
jgi:hypothetical protein